MSNFGTALITISIHVPAWGTTYLSMVFCACVIISIHVPAWGTTYESSIKTLEQLDFNPRSRVGNDFIAVSSMHLATRFQSTFPRGERRNKKERANTYIRISIHVPAWGTTNLDGNTSSKIYISIHVPAWGTTYQIVDIGLRMLISIHVPAWGTTRLKAIETVLDKFQSTFPRGERPFFSWLLSCFKGFQSTFPRGERQVPGRIYKSLRQFQSTFPRGERPKHHR